MTAFQRVGDDDFGKVREIAGRIQVQVRIEVNAGAQEVTKIECLGFLRGSHSPHYDAEAVRRPTYHRMIASGELAPGYACDNDAGIHFVDNEVHRVIKTREDASVYYVALEGGSVVETELPGEMIS